MSAGAAQAAHDRLDGALAPWQRRAWDQACAAMDAGRHKGADAVLAEFGLVSQAR